jgi:Zn-finger nucleic acid-binding protein
MQCPVDGTTLTMSERSGIEIDYCPQCRGVWLDRGELDKILERSAAHEAPAAPPPAAYEREPRRERYDSSQQPYRRKRKESWLSELFD